MHYSIPMFERIAQHAFVLLNFIKKKNRYMYITHERYNVIKIDRPIYHVAMFTLPYKEIGKIIAINSSKRVTELSITPL